MIVEVTQEDISNGIPGKCRRCPIALATTRAMSAIYKPDTFFIEVWQTGIKDVSTGKVFTCPEVELFIHRYDTDCLEDFKPFSFDLVWKDPDLKVQEVYW